MTIAITPATFRNAYLEVIRTNGINDLVCKLRQDPTARKNIKRQQLITMFTSLPLWKRTDEGDGHVAFQHALTHIRIGFQGHGKSSNISAQQAMAMMDQLQEHMNILGNNFFDYRTRNWKHEPNYESAVTNFGRLNNNSTAG